MRSAARVAIDVGGTFTDVVRVDPQSGSLVFEKTATTPEAPTQGVMNGFARVDAKVNEVGMFTHGTTLGLNALLTRSGARTAIISSRGFRDVYLLGRTGRRVNYDITFARPEGLVRRRDTFEVNERTLFDGEIHTALDIDDAAAVAARIAAEGYEGVAVAFLHSYVNPEHELRMRAILREYAPTIAVTLSHELAREYREYERTSTAVLDVYIKPVVGNYLLDLDRRLSDEGFSGRFLITHSAGGAMTAAAAMQRPVSLILSGPAGGVIGATAFSRLIGEPNLVTIDMGGTSLDASLVVDSEAVLYQGAEFEGLPINLPSLYIHTIGAGGGSIAWLDAAGALQVGPQSAGASPGPASYNRGGTHATVTDAAVVLEYLGPDSALGGTLNVDAELARRAIAPLAEAIGTSVPALARGILQISMTKIVGAVRAITVELGHDPRDFTLLSLGGAGGLVAVGVARELGIPRVIVPPGQGAFCAFGMLMADVQHDFALTRVMPLAALTPEVALEAFGQMEAEGTQRLYDEGLEQHEFVRSLDVRYRGQEHSVSVPYRSGDDVLTIETTFATLHERQYGHAMPDPVEVTTLRLTARGLVDKPELPRLQRTKHKTPEPVGVRSVHVDDAHTAVVYPLYQREGLTWGHVILGPAVIAEHTATTVIHAGDRLEIGEYGQMTIHVAKEGEGTD